MSLNLIIILRVSESQLVAITSKASEAGMTASDFIRQRTVEFRLRKSAAPRDKIREIAHMGANLNQIARWANTYKRRPEVIEVILHLDEISERLKRLATEDECT